MLRRSTSHASVLYHTDSADQVKYVKKDRKRLAVAAAFIVMFVAFIVFSLFTWSPDINNLSGSFLAGHHSLSVSEDRKIIPTEALKDALKGDLGFRYFHELGKEKIEEIVQSASDISVKTYFQNFLKRIDERGNWAQKHYSSRIACVIPLSSSKERYVFERVTSTFGEFCEKLMFFVPKDFPSVFAQEMTNTRMSNMEIITLPTTRETIDDGSNNLWERIHLMWLYLAQHYSHSESIDWFVKLDRQTFLSIHALKYFLKYYNPEVFHYFGHTLLYQAEANIIFNSGTCYVLSRSAVERVGYVLSNFTSKGTGSPHACVDRKGSGEDSSFGICLRSVGINPENTVNYDGRQRFLVFRHGGHLIYERKPDQWFWKHKPAGIKDLEDCCVDPYHIISESGFGDNPRDNREFRRIHRRHLKHWTGSAGSSDEKNQKFSPPVADYFYYQPGDLQLDTFGNIASPPKEQEIFDGNAILV